MSTDFDDDGPITDEELNRPRPRRQLRDRLYNEGRILSLLRSLIVEGPGEANFQTELARLHRLIRAKARVEPDRCADLTLQYGVGLVSNLVLRTGAYLERVLAEHDRRAKRQCIDEAPDKILGDILPSFLQLQRHLAELAQLHANTKRQLELTRAKRIENDRNDGNRRREERQPLGADAGDDLAPISPSQAAFTEVANQEYEIETRCQATDYEAMCNYCSAMAQEELAREAEQSVHVNSGV